MIGLRQVARDRELPARGGDPELIVPAGDHLREQVAAHLLAPGVSIESLRWEHARWKPGQSICATFALELSTGEGIVVVYKRYKGGKGAALEGRMPELSRTPDWLCSPSRVAGDGSVLWLHEADRALPGLRFVGDVRKLARELESTGLERSRNLDRKRLRVHLVRYKPERRAVLRVDTRLREPRGESVSFALRALPVRIAVEVAEARSRLGELDAPVVPLAGHLARRGILIERWIAGIDVDAPDDFRRAGDGGEILRRLHSLAAPAGTRVLRTRDEASDAAFLERFGLSRPRPVVDEPTCWVHGDFHPDQLGVVEGRTTLLDLDELAIGEPARDLAGWIADHVVADPTVSVDAAAEELLAGYGPFPSDRLRRTVADELVRRAVGFLRRLEQGAPERARELLVRARELVGERSEP